jgi:hypothetical protein
VANEDAAFEIQGRTLTLPVRVRDGDSWSAQFFVRARAAQAIVDPAGLEVAQPLPGRAAAVIAFASYRDTDLGAYDELAITFLVRPHGAARGSALDRMLEFARGEVAIYVHHLAATQPLPVEAQRTIWGYPSVLADIEVRRAGDRVECSLAHEGRQVLRIELHDGGPIRSKDPNLPNYSVCDGVMRMSEWNQKGTVLLRLGGTKLELGSHPSADELRSLGLPKRAFMSTTLHGLHAELGSVVEIGAAGPDEAA